MLIHKEEYGAEVACALEYERESDTLCSSEIGIDWYTDTLVNDIMMIREKGTCRVVGIGISDVMLKDKDWWIKLDERDLLPIYVRELIDEWFASVEEIP